MTAFDPNNLFSDLDTDPMAAPAVDMEAVRKAAHVVNGGESTALRTCHKCHGSGVRHYGYVNHTSYPCGWCKQTGKVSDKREANIARAIKAEATRQRNLDEKLANFTKDHLDEVMFLGRAGEWSDFYRSLLDQLNAKGALSEGQIAAIRRGMAKAAERAAERKAKQMETATEVDVSAIEALFDKARESGLKKLAFRTDRLHISPAPAHGRNAGAIYVKDRGEYAGKIVAGRFLALRSTAADVGDKLVELAADPIGVARFYGRETGVCCCCGRELTDPVSVANGIGPICEANWF